MNGDGDLLIGVGDPSRSDDRAGLMVVRRVVERVPAVSHLLVPCLDAAHVDFVAGHGRVIVADASLYGFGSSAILRRVAPGGTPAPEGQSLAPEALARLARRIIGEEPEVWHAAVRGFDFCPGDAVTDACRQGVERAVDLVVELLLRTGEPGRESRPRACRGSTRPQ